MKGSCCIITLNDTFRIRNQGVIRNFTGIEGVPSENIEMVNKGSAASLANIQLLESENGEYSLCLTYNDRRYRKESAVRFMELIGSSILRITGQTTDR